jgi:hypothetical protein
MIIKLGLVCGDGEVSAPALLTVSITCIVELVLAAHWYTQLLRMQLSV